MGSASGSRDLVRTGAGGLLVLAMVVGAVLMLVAVPLGWLYIGSRIQGAADSVGLAIAVMMVGAVVSIVALVPVLGLLNRKHSELQVARGRDAHGQVALEAVMTVSVVVAVLVFVVWFFVIEGPGPSLAPRQ